MQVDASQYQSIVATSFGEAETTLSAGEAELIIAIAQLAVAADRVDDRDERELFQTLAGHVYEHAKMSTSAPELNPIDDDDARMDHLRSHAAQLVGKPSAALAFALAYVLAIADLELAPEESEMLDALREALGLSDERAQDLSVAVAEAITPLEE